MFRLDKSSFCAIFILVLAKRRKVEMIDLSPVEERTIIVPPYSAQSFPEAVSLGHYTKNTSVIVRQFGGYSCSLSEVTELYAVRFNRASFYLLDVIRWANSRPLAEFKHINGMGIQTNTDRQNSPDKEPEEMTIVGLGARYKDSALCLEISKHGCALEVITTHLFPGYYWFALVIDKRQHGQPMAA